MALPSLPPPPLLTDVLDSSKGVSVARKMHRVWVQWLNAIVSRLQLAPLIVTTSYQKSITTALSNQMLLPAASNTQTALYRISYHNDLNTAGGKSTFTITYVCDGVSRTVSGNQVTSVTDPTSGVLVIDPDVNTAIVYGTTCVIPGPGIDYNLSVTLERIL
jgi:hypothetical protein